MQNQKALKKIGKSRSDPIRYLNIPIVGFQKISARLRISAREALELRDQLLLRLHLLRRVTSVVRFLFCLRRRVPNSGETTHIPELFLRSNGFMVMGGGGEQQDSVGVLLFAVLLLIVVVFVVVIVIFVEIDNSAGDVASGHEVSGKVKIALLRHRALGGLLGLP